MFRVQATSKQRKLMYAILVYTLFESKENSLHRTMTVAAVEVVASTYTIKYFYRIFVRNIFFIPPFVRHRVSAQRTTCFLFSNKRPTRDGICVKCNACSRKEMKKEIYICTI